MLVVLRLVKLKENENEEKPKIRVTTITDKIYIDEIVEDICIDSFCFNANIADFKIKIIEAKDITVFPNSVSITSICDC